MILSAVIFDLNGTVLEDEDEFDEEMDEVLTELAAEQTTEEEDIVAAPDEVVAE